MIDERTDQRTPPAPSHNEGPAAPTPIRAFLVVGCVMAIVIAATVASLIVPGTPRPQPPPPPPRKLLATSQPFAVHLAWAPPPSGNVRVFVVLRDGDQLATVRAHSFIDRTVEPGVTYHYAVESLGNDGAVSIPVAAQQRPPVPPASTAQVDGVFDVRLRVEESSGVRLRTQSPLERWRLTPPCPQGAGCGRLQLQDLVYPTVSGTLGLLRGAYRGAIGGYHGFTCGSPATRVRSQMNLSFVAAGAGVVDHMWRATRLQGTLREVASAPSGKCSTARILYSFTATLRA
ncbi:MAG TPA: hypothetical protein VEM41_04650 [Actinomycetota bacterium]|nr:hypothetical protein [Actinomycetota bacterium]